MPFWLRNYGGILSSKTRKSVKTTKSQVEHVLVAEIDYDSPEALAELEEIAAEAEAAEYAEKAWVMIQKEKKRQEKLEIKRLLKLVNSDPDANTDADTETLTATSDECNPHDFSGKSTALVQIEELEKIACDNTLSYEELEQIARTIEIIEEALQPNVQESKNSDIFGEKERSIFKRESNAHIDSTDKTEPTDLVPLFLSTKELLSETEVEASTEKEKEKRKAEKEKEKRERFGFFTDIHDSHTEKGENNPNPNDKPKSSTDNSSGSSIISTDNSSGSSIMVGNELHSHISPACQADEISNYDISRNVVELPEKKRSDTAEAEAIIQRRKRTSSKKRGLRSVQQIDDRSAGIFEVYLVQSDGKPKILHALDHGVFFEENCYIIVNALGLGLGLAKKRGLIGLENGKVQGVVALHLWIGKAASNMVSTAIRQMENINDRFGNNTIKYREFQGNESVTFLTYFASKSIVYLSKESDQKITPANVDEYAPKLYAVRKFKKATKVIPIPMRLESLNQKGVFILDIGTSFSLWCGNASSHSERYAAGIVTSQFVSRRRSHPALKCSRSYEQDQILQHLRTPEGAIPTFEDVRNDASGYDALFDDVSLHNQNIEKKSAKLWCYTDNEFEIKHEGKLQPDTLKSENIYLIQSNVSIILWIGDDSVLDDFTTFSLADKFIQNNEIDERLPVILVQESNADTCSSLRVLC